jgi:hypothetical protein
MLMEGAPQPLGAAGCAPGSPKPAPGTACALERLAVGRVIKGLLSLEKFTGMRRRKNFPS